MQAEDWKEIVRPYYLRWVHFPLRGRPNYFEAPWRYPRVPLTASAIRDLPAGAKPSFLFLPMSDWHARLQRPQHLATALAARGHTCFLLNPHLGRQFTLPYAFDRRARVIRLAERISELHIRLPREPVYHHRLLSDSETAVLAESLSKLAPAGPIVQILSFPSWGAAATRLRQRHGWPIVYDCHDLLSGFHNVDPSIFHAEGALLRQADYVLFSSLWLRDHYQSRLAITEDRVGILRNAVPRSFLDAIPERVTSTRSALTAGYFGALDRWFDTEAIRQSAERHPHVRFQLVGRVEFEPVRSLASMPNVEFCGELPHADLPRILANFNIGLIPFALNDLTRAANPIKLYEYFSAGIPVVSSRLPEVERFIDLVYLADGASQFAVQVGNALSEADPARRQQRIQAAAHETWDARAAQLADVASHLAHRT